MTGRNIFLFAMTVSLVVLILFIGDNWNKGKMLLMILTGIAFWMLMVKRYWSAKKRSDDHAG